MWKKIRYRFEYIGLLTGAWIVQCLPLSWLRPLGSFAGAVFFLFDSHRREVTLANLKAAFGEKFNRKQRWQIARKSYGIFATTVLELFWSPNLTSEVVQKIVTIEEVDSKPFHTTKGVSIIYCCLHAGNFEWVAQLSGSYYSSPLSLIAQKFKNPLIGPLFDQWRSVTGNKIIPQERAMLKTLRHLKAGGKMGLLIDLNLKPHEGPVVIRCFDRLLVPVTQLPAELALRTGAMLVPVECLPRPQGGHHIRFLSPITITSESSVASITQACWDALESQIQRHPELWLWSYKHWRYRPSQGESDYYPFYANCYDRFDKLLEEQGAVFSSRELKRN